MEYPSYIKVLVAKEISKTSKIHYHARVETSRISTQEGFRKSLKKMFPLLKGNAQVQTHVCKQNDVLKDTTLWKSKTYICKEGHIIVKKGYSQGEIDMLVQIGRKFSVNSDTKLYRKIILVQHLTHLSTNDDILTAIEEYYKLSGRPIPSYHIAKSLIHNILMSIRPAYVRQYKNHLLDTCFEISY